MEERKGLFGGINLTWPKVIIFAIFAGIYTAVMAIIPQAKDTSFADITISFEVWILFGIIIIMNSKSNLDSALKCFVFFLISQPLVYLIQVPFTILGWKILGYYRYWFIWTILTIPMGFIGYYMKKDRWWGLLILTPMLVLLGGHLSSFINQAGYDFPHHILSAIFCVITLLIYPIAIFNNKKIKTVGIIISILIIAVATFLGFHNKIQYNTTLLINGEKDVFDETYKVYIEDSNMGKVYIEFNENIEEYMLNASFDKTGKTKLTIESPSGKKQEYDLDVKANTYTIEKINDEEEKEININENMTDNEIQDAVRYDEGESYFKNDMVIEVVDSGDGINYTFNYKKYTFDAIYTEDNWKIIDSYKIKNRNDITLICQELIKIHPIHSADLKSFRTAEDLAQEWINHNIAYRLLPDDSEFKLNAKDVDLDPKDEGKGLVEMYKDRTGK